MNITSTASYNVGNSIRPSYMSQQQDIADPIKVNPTDTGVATEEKISPVEQKMEDKKQYHEEMKQKERRETDRDEFFDKQQQRTQEIATQMKQALTSHNFYNVGNDHDLALTKDNYEETVKGLFNKGFTVQSDDRQLTITSKLHQLKLEMSKESYNKYVELAYGQKFAEQVTGTSSADKKSSAVNSAGIYTNQIGSAAVKTASAAATTVGSVMNGTLQGVSSSSVSVKVENQVSGVTEALKVEAPILQHQNEAAAAQPQPVNTTQEPAASQPAPSNSAMQNTTTSSSSTTESTSTAATSNTGHTSPAAESSPSATSSSNPTSPTPAPAPTASTTSEPAPVVATSPAPVPTVTNSPIAAAPVAAFTPTLTSSPTTVPTSTTTSPAPTAVAPASTSTTTVPTNTTTTAPTSTTTAPTSTTTAAAPTSTTGTLAGVVNTTVTATTNTLNTTTSTTKNLVGGLRK